MSQYNNSIFYFVGTSRIKSFVNMTAVKNVTLHGLDQPSIIHCKEDSSIIWVYNSNDVVISNMSFLYCSVGVISSNNITITKTSFTGEYSDGIVTTLFAISDDSNDVITSDISFINYSVVVRSSNNITIAKTSFTGEYSDDIDAAFNIFDSNDVIISDMSFINRSMEVKSSNNITIANSSFTREYSDDIGAASFSISHNSNGVIISNLSFINYSVEVSSSNNITIAKTSFTGVYSDNSVTASFTISDDFDDSNNVTISDASFINCYMDIKSTNNITITNTLFIGSHGPTTSSLTLTNTFDVKIASSVFTDYHLKITYHHPWFPLTPTDECSIELHDYSLILTNVTFTGSGMELNIHQGTSYKVLATFDHVDFSNSAKSPSLFLGDSLFDISITKSSFHHFNTGNGLNIAFHGDSKSDDCRFPDVQLNSTLVIEDSRFYHNKHGLNTNSDFYFPRLQKVNCQCFIKSCLMYDNINEGISIDGTFMRLTQIEIIDTQLIGNGGNKIINSNAISLSNVTVANSTSTGLTLETSLVTIKNDLIFKNNTGVVGGGLAINDSSRLIISSSAYLEFIDNHASYKGGGFFVEESTYSPIILRMPNIPLTLINNSAGLVGGDMYGYHLTDNYEFNFIDSYSGNNFNLTNPHISSTGNPVELCFCDPHTATIIGNCLDNGGEKHIYPGQTLKYYVALFGINYYYNGLIATDGIVEVYDNSTPSSQPVNQTYIPNICSLIEYTPKLIRTRHHVSVMSFYTKYNSSSLNHIFSYFIVNECPIGFSMSSSQGSCTCSQSVSRENVTCDINSLNITHNGLLWIGTYDTSTPFNANATNPNQCIINEDCLLYCSPNPVTFKLNDTDTQCVDNRGQRMCGSCRDEYSLLMGSNKCGHCHNNYMMIAWIALFAVMGVLLVVLLIALNLTVSVGTLNGLLFYANIVKLYEPVFSRKGALPVLSQVISWINLDFGFEICFYNGMDSYAKQWLQFAFPLYLWIIIIIIIQLCRRYGKISRLMGSHAVPVLSTLFLLSYTKLVRTIVIVLHKREVTLDCTNESVRSVSLWYEDPNVEYAKGKHAGLFGFALLVSVFFVIPYTLFLLLNRFYEKYLSNFKVFRKFWSHFKPIIDSYSGPMKDEYRFWPGLLLVARIPILLSVTLVDSFIQSQHFLLSILLTVLAIVLSLGYCFGGVYKKRMNNVLEVWFLFNLCIMASLSIAFTDESKVLIWYNTCLSVFIFSFILIVVYHLYLQLSHMKCIKKLFKKQDEDDEPLLDITEIIGSIKTVDQQKREIVPSSTDIRRCASRESVVDLY